MQLNVTFGPKAGHPWESRVTGPKSIYIDGVNGGILALKRGRTYFFNVQQTPNNNGYTDAFYFTRDPVGGAFDNGSIPAKVDGTSDPVANGLMKFEVTKNTPSNFYYQSSGAGFAGGQVRVSDY